MRRRLDALGAEPPRRTGLLGWVRRRWQRGELTLQLPVLEALDRDLNRVGVLTLADARLLHRLGVQRGRAGALAQGLAARADEAFIEFERELGWAERAWRSGALAPGASLALGRGLVQLSRVLRVAEVFAGDRHPQDRALGLLPRAAPAWRTGAPAAARLAAAEYLYERARAEPLDVEARRRDLTLAHELLLHLGTEAERERTLALRWEVAQARERLAEAPAVRSLAALLREVRGATLRDPQRAYGLLRGLYERALEAGEEGLAGAVRPALEALLPEPEALAGLVERAEWEPLGLWGEAGGGSLAAVAYGLDPERLALLQLAAGSAHFFDVQAPESLSQVLAGAPRSAPRRVPYPTARLGFDTTGDPGEVASFVIQDPRRVLVDLAAHAQPVRAWFEEPAEPAPRERSAVRVYVCDASGSMQGARARLRDALLLSELAHLRQRALHRQPFDPVLFTLFDEAPGELVRVDSAAEATRQMERLFASSPAQGQTNITAALVSAFESLRSARAKDARLAHATLVLVTDGEDRVDLELLRRVRAPLGRVDIALSVISLGQENPDLRALVREQREQGARAFYQPLSDADLAWAQGAFSSPWRTLLPQDVAVGAEALEALAPHLEALEALATREAPRMPVVLEVSFAALFPEHPDATGRLRQEPLRDERVADILGAVAEVASLTGAAERARESQLLLRHLLQLYGLPAEAYLEALAAGGPPVREALARVRLLCAPLGGPRV
nr:MULTISPECIES: vWA domain-containing protein [Myxococcaceae]